MSLFAIWFWLAIGAFAGQAFGRHDWDEAFGCAFYQAVALSSVWLNTKARTFFAVSNNRGY